MLDMRTDGLYYYEMSLALPMNYTAILPLSFLIWNIADKYGRKRAFVLGPPGQEGR
jgi:hypothetical protein